MENNQLLESFGIRLGFSDEEMFEFLEKKGAIIETREEKIRRSFRKSSWEETVYNKYVTGGISETGPVREVFTKLLKKFILDNA